jgi:outer membrane protein assembly factor BamB
MKPKLWFLVPGAVALAASAVAAGKTSVQPWTTYQGNALHTGYVPVTLDATQFVESWSMPIGDSGASLQQATEADGMVYVSQNGYFNGQGLYVLNAQDGTILWNLPFPDIFSVNPPAYDDGNVYIQTVNNSGDTWVRAYEADSGTPIFQSAAAAQWENYLAPTIVDHTLYVDGGEYGGMYSFDGKTGAQNWFDAQLAQYDQWTPAVDATEAYTYLGSQFSDESGTFSAVNRVTGVADYTISDPNFVWTGWSMYQAPAIGTQNDALVFNGSRLLSFDLQKHRIRWTQAAGYASQPSVANGTIYIVNNGTLAALDESTGRQLWMWSTPADALSGPVAVTDSHVFVCGHSTTYAIDVDTHQMVWNYPDAGALTLSEGQLLIAGSTGTLTDISLGTWTGGGANLKETLSDRHIGIGKPGIYEFLATTQNRGPSNATRVTVTVKVPVSFGVQSMGSGCTLSGHDIICSYSGVSSGMTEQSRFALVPAKAGNYSVVAQAAATQADPFARNNIALAHLVVQ